MSFFTLLTNWPVDWDGDLSASPQEIIAAEQGFSIQLPSEYRDMLIRWKGGEGTFGKIYMVFWPINELMQLNNYFQIQRYLGPHIVAIGTNGGGIGICLDFRDFENRPRLVAVPLGDLDINELLELGQSFEDGILNSINENVSID